MIGEGMYPIKLITEIQGSTVTNDWGDRNVTSTPLELTRHAMRSEQPAGSETVTSDSTVQVSGTVTWTVRRDDELAGKLSTPKISPSWQLMDLETEELYDITSISEFNIRGGERRYKIHTRYAPIKEE